MGWKGVGEGEGVWGKLQKLVVHLYFECMLIPDPRHDPNHAEQHPSKLFRSASASLCNRALARTITLVRSLVCSLGHTACVLRRVYILILRHSILQHHVHLLFAHHLFDDDEMAFT